MSWTIEAWAKLETEFDKQKQDTNNKKIVLQEDGPVYKTMFLLTDEFYKQEKIESKNHRTTRSSTIKNTPSTIPVPKITPAPTTPTTTTTTEKSELLPRKITSSKLPRSPNKNKSKKASKQQNRLHDWQYQYLLDIFEGSNITTPNADQISDYASNLSLPSDKVRNWFMNQRAKVRRSMM